MKQMPLKMRSCKGEEVEIEEVVNVVEEDDDKADADENTLL